MRKQKGARRPRNTFSKNGEKWVLISKNSRELQKGFLIENEGGFQKKKKKKNPLAFFQKIIFFHHTSRRLSNTVDR